MIIDKDKCTLSYGESASACTQEEEDRPEDSQGQLFFIFYSN